MERLAYLGARLTHFSYSTFPARSQIPNWYHYKCFFKVARITDVSQVAGLGALRWEDQQTIRDKASGGDAEEVEEVDSSTSPRAASEFYFGIAPSGRSACRLCQQKIPKVYLDGDSWGRKMGRLNEAFFLTG